MRLIDADKIVYSWQIDADGQEHDGVTLKSIIDKMPTIEPERRWIPVSERLPEEQKNRYWVCTDTGYQYECRWTNINHIWTDLTTDWHWHIMDIPQYTNVVAWQRLPEPYRGEA